MTPAHRSRVAKKNLREGIKKMEDEMSPAAKVRRDFRLGRPPRPAPLDEEGHPEQLHPKVAWTRANEALSDFRRRMDAAKLNPQHAAAAIVYVIQADPDSPRLLPLEETGKTPEELQLAAFDTLGRPDVIALGVLFAQFDERTRKKAIFPYLFFGLGERGMAGLKKAASIEFEMTEMLKNAS